MASSSAFPSTADGNNCYLYDVFINHRGPDVKNTFASHLYRSLTVHGLRVFLDKEEMQKGEELTCQIEGAIQTASVHIVIFSTNYAQSKWCLNELLLMLKSMEERKSTIIPIFYDVKPSQLRWTEGDNGLCARVLRMFGWARGEHGVYAEALRQKGLKYDLDTTGKWRKALRDVADLSGFDLEAYNGRDEGQLLADVVERVLELVPKTPLYVSKFPTGLDDKVEDFKKRVLLRQHESGEARVVGIVGLGGVGKTTLAKHFFNGAGTSYRRSSFLPDVRENYKTGSSHSLQRSLIKDLTQQDVEIKHIHEGTSLLRRYLSPSNALIIVDDVDHIDQLNELVSPAKDTLGSNSLIIVTSRDKSVLINGGIDELYIYQLKGLDPQHSRELFCWHAFNQHSPNAGFEQVVEEFVVACDGLPLSLKVIGALLSGQKNLEHWKAQLRKFSKILPHDIQNTLKISYDSLDKEQKQIFVDTASFFIGEKKDTAIRIWDGCGLQGSLGIQNLQDKCLLEVEVTGEWDPEHDLFYEVEHIRMHDQVRDLGRSLSDEEPSRSFLWRVSENLLDQSPVHEIKNPAERHRRIAELKGSWVESVFNVGQSPQLIMLSCYNCPDSSLASKFTTDNLRILHIRGQNVEILRHLESQAPLELRELYIDSSSMPSKITEFIGKLKHLEKIVLNCGLGMPLETLPDEFCQLRSLKHLKLSRDWGHLRSLPDSFGSLTSLQFLALSGCDRLEILPESFGNLSTLQHLYLSHCGKLKMLPDSLGSLTKLQHISLTYCSELQMLPDSFGNLTSLQEITLISCDALQKLPNSFGNLIHLKYLGLESCEKLTISSQTLGKITRLQLFSCMHVGNIKVFPPQLTYQRSLQALALEFGSKELPSAIGNLSNLKYLHLKSSSLETLPPSFGDLRSLEELWLDYCPLKCFPNSVRMLSKLKKLAIHHIENLQVLEIKEWPSREVTFQNVGGEVEPATDSGARRVSEASYSNAVFPNLQQLEIEDCDRLVEVGALPTTLQILKISQCRELEELTCMETWASVEHLSVWICDKLKRIDGLAQLTKLKALNVGFSNLEELTFMETWTSLEYLSVCVCDKLKRIDGLGQLTKLKWLSVEYCSELEELPGVEHSLSLSKVLISRCPKLKRQYETSHRTCKFFNDHDFDT